MVTEHNDTDELVVDARPGETLKFSPYLPSVSGLGDGVRWASKRYYNDRGQLNDLDLPKSYTNN
jgi:hypothetical protein